MLSQIRTRIVDSFTTALKTIAPDTQVTPTLERPKQAAHGDAACNIAMQLAKPLGKNPRQLAQELIDAMPANPYIGALEIAGPGFINFFQNTQALANRLDAALADAHVGVRKAGPLQRVAIDLSAPNLAKEMHVGHLRSTIIGDGVDCTLRVGDAVAADWRFD